MAIIINTIDDDYFELNNLKYVKQFLPTKQGVNHISIGSSQNSSLQILTSTHFSEFIIDDKRYESLKDCINDLLPIIFSNNTSELLRKIEELDNRIKVLESNLH